MSSGDIFEGLSIDFNFADSSFANNTSSNSATSLTGGALPDLTEPSDSVQNSLIEVELENENKRVRINRSKHKRVHSDPNVLSQFAAEQQSLLQNAPNSPPQHVDRVDLNQYYGMDVSNSSEPLPDALPIKIGGGNSSHQKLSAAALAKPPRRPSGSSSTGTNSGGIVSTPPLGPSASNYRTESVPENVLDGMDDFLNMFPMSEIKAMETPPVPTPVFNTTPYPPATNFYPNGPPMYQYQQMNYHNQKIQEGVDQLKSKRKRAHQRHHSNPVDLLHNLDQIRQLAQQAKLGQESTGSYEFGESAEDANPNRRQYKCGRCGKPKVGHVCTMPDQRNNFSQVDLQITKGLKAPDASYKVLTVKNPWIAAHPDYSVEEE